MLGATIGVMLREYMGRRVLQRVERVMKRSHGKEDSLPCSPPFVPVYLGSLFGATRQSVGFVIWPWQNVCGYHLLFYFCFFSFQSLIFLSFFFAHVFLALALWLMPGFPWLSFLSFQCANNIVFLIFLLITVYFQGMIQSKCIGSKEIFSTEFGVVALSGTNPLALNGKPERKLPILNDPKHWWGFHDSHTVDY